MLNTVRTIVTGQVQEYPDEFNVYTLNADWTHGGWTLYSIASNGLPTVAGSAAVVYGNKVNDLRTAVLADQGVSTTSYREVSLSNWLGQYLCHAYLMLDMDDASPDPMTGGIWLAAEWSGYASYLALWKDSSVIAFKQWNSRIPGGNWHTKLSIDNSNVVRAYWSNPSVPDLTYSLGTYVAAGGRVGFGLRAPNQGTAISANKFLLRYFADTGTLPETALVGSSNGSLYYESTTGTMVAVSTTLTTTSEGWISSDERLAKLYIADYGIRCINDTNTATTSASTLTDGAATFVTDGVDAQDDMVEITYTDQVVDGVRITGTWPISSITDETHIVVTGTLGNGTTVSYRVMRAPKVFDTETLTLTRLTASAGKVPPDCKIVVAWNDRLCWAGDDLLPEAVYMSKIGDPTDYDYGTNLLDEAFVYDPARVAGAPFIGDRVTALIPHLDDYLLIGCRRSMWIQRGDPALGAPPEAISREIGVLSQSAWCYTPENTVVAMTLDGLYLIAPNSNSQPIRLSRERLPQELVNINTELYDVLLEYDTLRNGINIFVTGKESSSSRHFWFGWALQEFSPESYDPDHEPTAITSHAISGVGPRRVIYGCRDGYLRMAEDSEPTDDGENFHSYVLIGPIMLGGDGYHEGMIREIVGQLATDSGEVTMKIRVGDSIESAYAASSRVEYPMRAGKNRTWRPNLRGSACYIELSSGGGEAWAFEQLTLVRERLGKQRLLS